MSKVYWSSPPVPFLLSLAVLTLNFRSLNSLEDLRVVRKLQKVKPFQSNRAFTDDSRLAGFDSDLRVVGLAFVYLV